MKIALTLWLTYVPDNEMFLNAISWSMNSVGFGIARELSSKVSHQWIPHQCKTAYSERIDQMRMPGFYINRVCCPQFFFALIRYCTRYYIGLRAFYVLGHITLTTYNWMYSKKTERASMHTKKCTRQNQNITFGCSVKVFRVKFVAADSNSSNSSRMKKK